jgi:hypothetical protein
MDSESVVEEIREFLDLIDRYDELWPVASVHHGWPPGRRERRKQEIAERELVSVAERLRAMEPAMMELMEAAERNLSLYDVRGRRTEDVFYWSQVVRPRVLRALGIHLVGSELVADRLHPWVWEAAGPWTRKDRPEAVLAAAKSVSAQLQQKLGRYDLGEAKLCREAFSRKPPGPGQPRLRFPGNRNSSSWKSRQQGGIDFGAGCFEALRNPAAHEHELELDEQIALEQLAALSLLARWIDECRVEKDPGPAQP